MATHKKLIDRFSYHVNCFTTIIVVILEKILLSMIDSSNSKLGVTDLVTISTEHYEFDQKHCFNNSIRSFTPTQIQPESFYNTSLRSSIPTSAIISNIKHNKSKVVFL